MEIYFIRHGETQYNKKHLHQSADVPLNELGKKQATNLAKIVGKINPTHIISSPYIRAKETAEIASKDLQPSIESNDLFIELVRSNKIIDKHHFAPRSLLYMCKWFLSKNEFYQDAERGESRLAFLNRLHDAKEYIESLPQDARVVVFSHSVFINFFMQHICNEKPLTLLKSMLLLLKIKTLGNSSLTHVTYDPTMPDGSCKWCVMSFNDDEHVIT